MPVKSSQLCAYNAKLILLYRTAGYNIRVSSCHMSSTRLVTAACKQNWSVSIRNFKTICYL